VEAQILYEKMLKEAALVSRGRAELLEAVQHHPDSPYKEQHAHPLGDHIEAVRRDVNSGTAILDEILRSDLTGRQRRQIEKYAAERKNYLENGLLPACEALLAGRYDRANEILLYEARPLYMPVFEDGGNMGDVGSAERTVYTLSLFFGTAMALSFLVMILM
jgi:hypothetical protein